MLTAMIAAKYARGSPRDTRAFDGAMHVSRPKKLHAPKSETHVGVSEPSAPLALRICPKFVVSVVPPPMTTEATYHSSQASSVRSICSGESDSASSVLVGAAAAAGGRGGTISLGRPSARVGVSC